MPSNNNTRKDGFDYVKFSVDAELLRELGERLVGKPHVALAELVKNAYDADATHCIIKFDRSSIEVTDNGNGMSREEFVGKWMRVGSTHKRSEQNSPRLHRVLTGSKGIGRLSAQFLGSKIEVHSISVKNPRESIEAKVDWTESYSRNSLVEAGAWIKEVAIQKGKAQLFKHGTRIIIRGLKETWTSDMFKELAAELWFLQPPPAVADEIDKKSRFKIELQGIDELDLLHYESQTTAALGNWIAKLEGKIENGRATGKAKLRLTFSDGEVISASYPLPNKALDKARFEILVFKLSGKQAGGIPVLEAREYFKRFGGVHIYDSGFRLPYYGGGEQDWLNIEMDHSHRLIQSQLVPEKLRSENGTLQDLPTLGRVFGVVKISTAHEMEEAPPRTHPSRVLTVQVTRDKLIDNRAFADLIHFVRWAFDYYSYASTSRRAKEVAEFLGQSVREYHQTQFETVRTRALELKQKVDPKFVEPLERALDSFQEAERKRKQEADAERVLLGALATAGMGSVALQHELAKELKALEIVIADLELKLPDNKSDELENTLKSLSSWVKTASQTRQMFSPFFDSEDRDQLKRLRAARTIKRVAANLAPLLRGISVEADSIPETLRLPEGTFAGWSAVFQNILVNAVNATLEASNKRIRCRASVDANGRAKMVIEDTGVGVDLDDSAELFEPFVRKLELPEDRKALGLGGMGIGLTIVKMVCQTFGCDVQFVKPKSPFQTALELSWEAGNG